MTSCLSPKEYSGIRFKGLLKIMVESDLKLAQCEVKLASIRQSMRSRHAVCLKACDDELLLLDFKQSLMLKG